MRFPPPVHSHAWSHGMRRVQSGTVDQAIVLKGACNCALTITGGTEVGHAAGTNSHYNGYKLDFRHSAGLDNYIKSAFTKIGNRGDGYPQWRAASGNLYCVGLFPESV